MSLGDASVVQVVQRGTIKAIRLNDKVTSGRQQWIQFHKDFTKKKPAYDKVQRIAKSPFHKLS